MTKALAAGLAATATMMALAADSRYFASITKVDEDQRMVYGYASTTALDSQDERITREAMSDALGDYMKFANIREMHGNSAVGVAKSADMRDDGIYVSAHVVDDSAWKKVKAGVYKGFSIGGKSTMKKDGVISAMRLSEISLVDRPANPECVIELWKGDGITVADDGKAAKEAAVTELAELLNKGAIDPARLLAIAKGDITPPAAAATVAAVAAVEPSAGVVTDPAPVAKAEAAEPSTEAAERLAALSGGGAAGQPAAWEVAKAQREAAEAAIMAKGAPAAVVAAVATAAAPAAPVAVVAEVGGGEVVAKAAEAPAAGAGAVMAKGMANTAQLAMLLKQLGYLVQNQNDETKREKDNSMVPAMLHDLLTQGGKALVAMATEEAAELVANVDPDADATDGAASVSPASYGGGFSYAAKTGDVAKAGSRFSAETVSSLAAVHDCFKAGSSLMDKLGYIGGTDSTDSGTSSIDQKGDTTGDIAKVAGERDEALAKYAALEANVVEITKRFDALQAVVAKMPTVPRGRLLVIQKGDDLGGEALAKADSEAKPDGPILKADGSVDQEASALAAMRKVHASGGLLVARR